MISENKTCVSTECETSEANNDLQNITQKTNERALRTSLRSVGELKCSGKMWQIERNDAQ
jgi:hypothetical protein